MKLNEAELNGLRQMIEKTSSKVLDKYKRDALDKEYDYLFIGDSIIEYFDLIRYIPGHLAINRGVAGATTAFLLENLDTIIGEVQPKEVFLSIGSNDLVLLESTVEEAYLGIVEVFNRLKEKLPQAKIHYLSTTPVIEETNVLYKRIYIGGRTNEQLRGINEKVKTYAKDNGVNFLPIFDDLVDETGYLKMAFTADGIHLNDKGYEVYAQTIESAIATPRS